MLINKRARGEKVIDIPSDPSCPDGVTTTTTTTREEKSSTKRELFDSSSFSHLSFRIFLFFFFCFCFSLIRHEYQSARNRILPSIGSGTCVHLNTAWDPNTQTLKTLPSRRCWTTLFFLLFPFQLRETETEKKFPSNRHTHLQANRHRMILYVHPHRCIVQSIEIAQYGGIIRSWEIQTFCSLSFFCLTHPSPT